MINISRPTLDEDELDNVIKAVKSGWISSQGEFLQAFERSFAEFCDVEHCVLVSNGTVAIHLALEALNIGAGDEVIIPDLTFVATANAVRTAGAIPVIADVDHDTWCIDPKDVEKKITPRTKAIIPVHIYGGVTEMDTINELAAKHSLYVIEDAAEAHGATYKGKKVGGLGTVATFSFYGNKIITTGEGGAITTNSKEIAEKARILRDHGMSKTKRYWYEHVGYNYRMTNIQAAIGLAQMTKITRLIEERDNVLDSYRSYLEPHGISMNPRIDEVRSVNWISCVLLPESNEKKRDQVLVKLTEAGIENRPFFYPLSHLPIYKRPSGKIAERLSFQGLNLPTFNGITNEQIHFISSSLIKIIDEIFANNKTI